MYFKALLGNQMITTIRKMKTEFPNSYLLIFPSVKWDCFAFYDFWIKT